MPATLNMLWLELRNGLRQLTRRAAHSTLIVAVLAMGLGATLFVLVVIDALVLRPMPFPDAERLVQIGEDFGRPGFLGQVDTQDFLDLRESLTQVDAIESYSAGTINLSDGDRVERYDGQFVTAGLFELVGVGAQIGRVLGDADDRPGAPLRAVISDRVWRQRFSASPDVLGQSIQINLQPAQIVGVMPPRFAFPFASDVWVAARYSDGQPAEARREAEVIARLKPGGSLDEAAMELQSVWQRLQQQSLESRRDLKMGLQPAENRFVNPHTRSIVTILLVAALSVLLVACANVANLQLALLSQRSRELALRNALGAGRTRLLVALLSETLVLTLVATAVALMIAHWAGVYAMRTFVEAGDGPAYWIEFAMTPRVAAFGIGIAALTTIAAGLMPGVRASGFELQRAIVNNGRAGGGASRIARVLIVAQVAFSCVLLIGAGMAWRQLDARSRFDIGLDTPRESLLTARAGIFPEQYPTGAEQVGFFERVAERLRAEPGVLAATAADTLPGLMSSHDEVLVEGRAEATSIDLVAHARIDDGFAQTYGLRALSGRLPDARDTADSLPVAVVDQRFADRYWPGQDPLQRRFKLGTAPDAPWLTVVGVVRNLTLDDVDDDPRPSVLLPMRQSPVRFATLAVHVAGSASAFAPRLAEIVREVDADTPVYWVRTLEAALAADRVGDRFLTRLFGAFGAVGLLLAGAGLFGVLAQVVQARTREIGVRRAIGATGRQVVTAVAGDSARLLLIGLVLGIGLGVPWAMLLAQTSLGLDPFDPLIFGSVVALVALAGAMSLLVPTRRALGIAPSEALRSE